MAQRGMAPVLGPDFLKRLERLHLRVRRILSGTQRAERRSRRLGSSLEFADYRTYAPGDDPRRIDWGIFGRTNRLVTKLYEEEEDLSVAILVDSSASMRWPRGEEESRKWTMTLQLAASLSYLGLNNLDRVGVWFFDDALRGSSGVYRGKKAFHELADFLGRPPTAGTGTNLEESLTRFVQRSRRKALALVLTDGLDPAGPQKGLSVLAGYQFEVHLIQVMDPRECDPEGPGDLQLRDCESGDEIRATASTALLAAYRAEVALFQEELKSWCRRNAAGYSLVLADGRFDDVVLRMLRRDGLLR